MIPSTALTSLAFEKVCVLFNIAALQSAVAGSQSLDADEGLKLATKLYQQAGGIFQMLKGAVPAAIPQEPTPDLSQEVLQVLSTLMVAQAQEIFVQKAIKDSMKDLVIAKLCCQCEELYADVLRGMQKEAVRTLWDKEYINTVAGKQAGFHAMTQLYTSLDCRSRKKVGEEISRLQHAVELFKTAQTRSGKATLMQEYLDKAQRNLVESKKDNDFIYNEIIPDVKTLESPGKVQLAKPLPLAAKLSQNHKDLFGDLVPVALHQALAASEARRAEAVNAEIMRLREATTAMNVLLSSLNLPAAIETSASGSVVPPSVLEKAEEMRSKGGIQSIRTLITELPESLNRNKEILDECERMLKDERDSDDQLRSQFKEKWTRTPSSKLNESFLTTAAKYREIINNAVQADKVVQNKFETNKSAMETLSQGKEEVERAVQAVGGASGSVGNSAAVQKLRQLMEQVETIKAERDVIESELKSATVSMKDQFLAALAQDGAINEPALSVPEIGKRLQPLQNQVAESVRRQGEMVREIEAAHAQFTAEKGGSSVSGREALLTQLATAFDIFTELQSNLKEGTKFYSDLTQLLIVFQNKISDFCFARKTEKEELMKDLTQQTSRAAAGPAATPQVPSHHANIAPTNPHSPPQSAAPAAVPYPTQMNTMPQPFGATPLAPYPTYVAPPMPQGFNPYATLPYPQRESLGFLLQAVD